MKLRELKRIVSKALDELVVTHEQQARQDGTYTQFSNVKRIRNAMSILEDAGLFQSSVQFIKGGALYNSAEDRMVVKVNEGSGIVTVLTNLRESVNALNQVLDQVVVDLPPDSVSIKLSKVGDLADLSKDIEEFNTIISQTIINDDVNGEVKIENIENGSIWIDVFVGSATAVIVLGSLAWAAAVVYKKVQEGRMFSQHARSLDIKNDSLEDLLKAQRATTDLLIESEAQHLYDEYYKTAGLEQVERLKHSIKLLSNQIDKGAELHPALNAPEDVKNLFPDIKMLPTLESRIKKLEA